jgi:hypothetical protein
VHHLRGFDVLLRRLVFVSTCCCVACGGIGSLLRRMRGLRLAAALLAGASARCCASSAHAVVGLRKGLDRPAARDAVRVLGLWRVLGAAHDSSFACGGRRILRSRAVDAGFCFRALEGERFCVRVGIRS